MMACDMGNSQCDALNCENNRCNNEFYKSPFGNMSWA